MTMTDVIIKGGLTQDNAILLLAAVESLGKDPSEVRTTLKGFVTSQEIADEAGVETYDPDAEFNAEIDEARAAVEASEPVDDEDEDGRPKDTDNKAAWVEFAKSKGATDEDLVKDDGKDFTKADIIAAYGAKE